MIIVIETCLVEQKQQNVQVPVPVITTFTTRRMEAELLQFLKPDARVDVRRSAVDYLVGLTGLLLNMEFLSRSCPGPNVLFPQ